MIRGVNESTSFQMVICGIDVVPSRSVRMLTPEIINAYAREV
jgi:hypothetical protein